MQGIEARGAVKRERRRRFPLGMMALLAYIAYTIVKELTHLADLKNPAHAFGVFTLTGLPATGYSILVVLGLSVALYGLWTRREWARIVAVAWFLVGMAIPVLDLLVFLVDPQGMMPQTWTYAEHYFWSSARYTPFLSSNFMFLASMLDDPGILMAFLLWDLMMAWSIGLTAILCLYRQNDISLFLNDFLTRKRRQTSAYIR
jgi:hypothetical protein